MRRSSGTTPAMVAAGFRAIMTAVAVVACAALAAPTSAWTSSTTQVDVFVAGDGNYSCFRVPSIVEVGSGGTLLAFAEARQLSCDDQAPKDIVLRRSHDGGVTWGALQRVATGPGGSDLAEGAAPAPALSNFTARNPYAVVLPDTTVLLQYAAAACPLRAVRVQVRT